MKFEISGCEKETIKCYKISTLKKKIKIYFVNKLMRKSIVIPYTQENEKKILECMEKQLDKFVEQTNVITIKQEKYNLYSKNREEIITTPKEEETFNLKHLDINANTIDKISKNKLQNRIAVLKSYRKALCMLESNGIATGKSKKKIDTASNNISL